MPNPPITYLAYLRDSGGDTQELSTSQQQAEIERWANANHTRITHYYRDEARPGSSTIGRDGFLAMIDHFRHNPPETGLVIWRWSRFSRDINDAQYYRADLRRRGYRIVSINDNLPEGPEAILFEAALDWSNQRFLDDLSRDVKRGLHNLVLQYGCVPGTPPRGFIRQPVEIGRRRDGKPHIAHRWVPDPQLISTVQRAFAMRAAGRSLREIHTETHLYNSLNSYLTFFTNPLYIGRLEFADLVVENYCEPLIDEQTWNAVQAKVTKYAQRKNLPGSNPDHPRRASSPYLLSGLLHCARCGSPYAGINTAQRNGKSYPQYLCARAKRRHDCTAKPLPCKIVDQTVLNTILETLANPAYLFDIENRQQANHHKRLANLESQREELTGRLAVTRRTIANLTNALETSIESYKPRAIIVRLQELETQEYELLTQLDQLETEINTPTPMHTTLERQQIANQIAEILNTAPLQEKRRFLRGVIQTITIDRDGSLITGQIIAYHPPGPDPPIKTVTMSHPPVGAPTHSYSFTATLRKWQRKRP